MRRITTLVVALITAALGGAPAATAATAPPAAVKIATSAARARFHTTHIRDVFSLRSRRDAGWVLVDGFATPRNRLWAAWLHGDTTGHWALRYFDTTAPFQPQSTRNGRVPCDVYPAFSEARCPPPGTPTPAQIKATLFKQLAPTGNAAKIGTLLRSGGYSFFFKPPGNGSLVIGWYLASKPTLIARGNADFFSGRTGRTTIKLTTAGKRILRSAKTLKLTAKGTFTPILYAAASTTRTCTLTR